MNRVIIALAGLVGATLPAQAQVRVTASAVAGRVTSALVLQGQLEEGSGVWTGGRIGLQIGRIGFEGLGLRGTLSPAAGTAGFEREGGEMRGDVTIRATDWLALEGSHAVRAFDSPVGYQKWTMSGIGVRLSTTLGAPGFTGYLRPQYLASVSLEGQSSADMGVRFEGGFAIAPAGSPFVIGGFYRFERFDFADAATGRLEHFDVLGLSVGLRLPR